MTTNSPRPYLICYDIADPKRLGRLHRIVSDYAIMVQYSVYLARLSPATLRILSEAIDTCINPKRDDVRIYPLPERPSVVSLGRGTFAEGLTLFSQGELWTML